MKTTHSSPLVPRLFFFLLLSLCVLLPLQSEASAFYTFDTHNRLTKVAYANGAAEEYTYDTAGNRLSSLSTPATTHTYEDAEDGLIAGWDIYDQVQESEAAISSVFDQEKMSRVIEFNSNTSHTGYRLRKRDGSYWNDWDFKIMEWGMRFQDDFTIYIAVQTAQGLRYLTYSPVNGHSLGEGTYIHHGLGNQVKDGKWHTLARDLQRDLQEAQPHNTVQAVLGFLIRGNGRIDDIRTRADRTVPSAQPRNSQQHTASSVPPSQVHPSPQQYVRQHLNPEPDNHPNSARNFNFDRKILPSLQACLQPILAPGPTYTRLPASVEKAPQQYQVYEQPVQAAVAIAYKRTGIQYRQTATKAPNNPDHYLAQIPSFSQSHSQMMAIE